jgi:hypothetical protein
VCGLDRGPWHGATELEGPQLRQVGGDHGG